MKIYTGTGDDGTTSLVGGRRVSKTDIRLEAYGTVDELNANIGLLASHISVSSDIDNLRWIQNRLFSVGGSLATDTDTTPVPERCHVTSDDIERIERMIDAAGDGLPVQKAFILPGGCTGAAVCHVARTVCRRAERCVLRLNEQHPLDSNLLVFLNRLSDYLFVMSRRLNFLADTDEIFWSE
ncbi:MAG: cob(I)yrinic acid a,c-diamide adenosyltransferase [Bacteroidaceae bacterium]|nr:cob(I)yrinic acid a,c-diamide adenosyltransferase [Bacteroidaceae bacterium]